MQTESQVEIRIESSDLVIIEKVKNSLQTLNSVTQEPHRADLATIISIMASVVSLSKSLIELWKQIKTLNKVPPIKVETESGASLDLSKVKTETEIHDFLRDNS